MSCRQGKEDQGIAAAPAENRAISVHSGPGHITENYAMQMRCTAFPQETTAKRGILPGTKPILREAISLNRGVSKPGCFPLFSGKVQIVPRTLSGLFLVGALNRPRKRKRTNRENSRTIPEQIWKIPETSGKDKKGQKRTKKDKKGQKRKDKSRSGNPPRLKPPRLAALDNT